MATSQVVAGHTSLIEAQGIFRRGTDCFGPQEVRQIGFEIGEVPPIPLGKTMLAHLRTLGVSLEWHEPETMKGLHDRLGNEIVKGTKLLYNTDWYRENSFYTTEKSAVAHWRVVTKAVVPNSISKEYLPQTRVLAEYLRDKVFSGGSLPEKFRLALEELNDRHRELSELVESDWKAVAEQIAGLSINQLCRGTAVQSVYGLALHKAVNDEFLLSGMWDWTKSRSSDGRLVLVGDAASGGVYVYDGRPGRSDGSLGVRLSCSVEDLVG